MRLLYIVPKIKNAGGVARVIAVKANYFAVHFGYDVHILSQNEASEKPFYDFDSKISFHNMTLQGNAFQFFSSFKKNIIQKIQDIQPDIILVADNGLKAFLIPFIKQTKIPVVFECHGSKFVEEHKPKTDFFSQAIQKIKYNFKDFAVRKFTKIVLLSDESLKEWNVENGIVIPNPTWITTDKTSDLKNKKVIAVARNSYEKGLDRLLMIWKEINQKHPDWTLDIYTDEMESLQKVPGVNYFPFEKNIEEKYKESSIYAMTSRTEGFGMVLLEAMSLGIPCLAFDCPIGPRTLINNNENGFLIPDNNFEMYIEKLSFLIENEEVRMKFGKEAKQTSENFSVDTVMKKWKTFFDNIITAK